MTRSAIKTPTWILAAAGVSRDTTDDRSAQPPYNHLLPKRSAAQPPGIYKQTLDRQQCNVIVFFLLMAVGLTADYMYLLTNFVVRSVF